MSAKACKRVAKTDPNRRTKMATSRKKSEGFFAIRRKEEPTVRVNIGPIWTIMRDAGPDVDVGVLQANDGGRR